MQSLRQAELPPLQDRSDEADDAAAASLSGLRQQLVDTEAKRNAAEVLVDELRQRLAGADQARDIAVAQQIGMLDDTHREELQAVRDLCSATEAQRHEAQREASHLRERLTASERGLSQAREEELNAVRRQHAMAEAAEQRAEEMRARLQLTEAEVQRARARQREFLDTPAISGGPSSRGEGSRPVEPTTTSTATATASPTPAELRQEEARVAKMERRLAAAVLSSATAAVPKGPPGGGLAATAAAAGAPEEVTKGPGGLAATAAAPVALEGGSGALKLEAVELALEQRLAAAERAVGEARPSGGAVAQRGASAGVLAPGVARPQLPGGALPLAESRPRKPPATAARPVGLLSPAVPPAMLTRQQPPQWPGPAASATTILGRGVVVQAQPATPPGMTPPPPGACRTMAPTRKSTRV